MKSPDLLLLTQKLKNTVLAKQNTCGLDLAWVSSLDVSSQPVF